MIGPNVGKYDVIEEVSRSPWAAVYWAKDTALERLVALKSFPDMANDTPFVEAFEREVITAAQFDHPILVTLY